ncbi:MAG: hypothetical protein IPJ40_18385 [Saprospirales bacterium]|nr:hypothetical protein [Saprospirales bacterium]
MTLRRTLQLNGLTVQLDSLTNFDELFDQLLAKGRIAKKCWMNAFPTGQICGLQRWHWGRIW